ncbi:hypothetical protein T439DRAFT_216835 [Meredithblackwellia eburnea MCA 4105]
MVHQAQSRPRQTTKNSTQLKNSRLQRINILPFPLPIRCHNNRRTPPAVLSGITHPSEPEEAQPGLHSPWAPRQVKLSMATRCRRRSRLGAGCHPSYRRERDACRRWRWLRLQHPIIAPRFRPGSSFASHRSLPLFHSRFLYSGHLHLLNFQLAPSTSTSPLLQWIRVEANA